MKSLQVKVALLAVFIFSASGKTNPMNLTYEIKEFQMGPDHECVIREYSQRLIPVVTLREGDEYIVRPGDQTFYIANTPELNRDKNDKLIQCSELPKDSLKEPNQEIQIGTILNFEETRGRLKNKVPKLQYEYNRKWEEVREMSPKGTKLEEKEEITSIPSALQFDCVKTQDQIFREIENSSNSNTTTNLRRKFDSILISLSDLSETDSERYSGEQQVFLPTISSHRKQLILPVSLDQNSVCRTQGSSTIENFINNY